jgi:selenocysteine lyase/cysteine desulfurase
MPNYPAIYAIDAALDYISHVGVSNINTYAQEIVSHCLDGVADLPVELLGPRNPTNPSAIIAFKHPDFEAINAVLHSEGIHVMAHAGRVRVSIHGYNTQSDVDRFLEVLRRALQL